MRAWTLPSIAFSLALASCAIAPPGPNPWDELELRAADIARPVALPAPPAGTVEGDRLYFTPAEAEELLLYLEVAEGNGEIGAELAAALEDLSRAYSSAVTAGSAEHELSESRRVQLEEERRARLWDKLSVWSVLALLGAASL